MNVRRNALKKGAIAGCETLPKKMSVAAEYGTSRLKITPRGKGRPSLKRPDVLGPTLDSVRRGARRQHVHRRRAKTRFTHSLGRSKKKPAKNEHIPVHYQLGACGAAAPTLWGSPSSAPFQRGL